MSGRHATLPDVLVLGAGGVLGEAWMHGVLSGLEDAAGLDFRRCEILIGTSAGSIVAARLAAGRPPRRPRPAEVARAAEGPRASEPASASGSSSAAGASPAVAAVVLRGLRRGSDYAGALAAPVVSASMRVTAPGGALVRAGALARVQRPLGRLDELHERVAASGVRFDGRLRIVAVERRRGRRVVFGAPGGPAASVPDAVLASCSVPWLFAPVLIGGKEYVDGVVWSPTNLDLAPGGRGTRVLCLTPTGGGGIERTLQAAARVAGRSATELEALALRHRGQRCRVIGPDRAAVAAMGEDLMSAEREPEVLAAGYRQGRAINRSLW